MGRKEAKGEMPFLDHLEELRWRILWSLLALVVGSVIGFVVVQHFDVLGLLKRPISPFLPDDKLFITRPTDAFMLTMKLAVAVGVVLAAPVLVWQAWGFFSPALHEKERKFFIPASIAGVVLFGVGVWVAYEVVLPKALGILLTSFQRSDLEFIITANEYFGFATQLVLAFGVMFELPLVIVMLAAFRLVNPSFFARNRPFALIIAAVIAAFLTPPDVLSLLMMLAPLLVLYETGILVGRLVWKSRSRTIGTAALLAFALLHPSSAEAQERRRPPPPPRRPRPDSLVPRVEQDSLRRATRDSLAAGGRIDTATARQLGLPTGPSRAFPQPDSVMRALFEMTGYRAIRYAADSVVLHADSQQIDLVGSALVRQDEATLEADTVLFLQADGELLARGSPKLFEGATVLVGEEMRYLTDERRGFIEGALTNFQQSGVDWFLRGGISVDSASVRLYSGHSDVTSCDLPDPHYYFRSGSVKWVTNTIMVARPAVLYVHDVPVLWLPFIFQDMRPGRRTGILVPRFGINDLVRPNAGYRRHISNVGFYVVLNDYVDVRTWLDWFAKNSVTTNGELRYRWRDRFVSGGLSISRIFESGIGGAPGGRSMRLRWGHQQNFDQRTRLNASVDYATSSRVVERNAVDPFLATATLGSNINFSKQFAWGTLGIGGSRRQELTSGSVTQTFPTLSLTPVPIDIADNVTWSPSVSISNARAFGQRAGVVQIPAGPGDTILPIDSLFSASRTTDIQISTPLRIGRWNWANSFSIRDFVTRTRSVEKIADSASADTVTRFVGVDFNTGIDWNTGINLPALFPSSWKLQPRLGIQNTTSGPFLLRNRNTGGRYVRQGKRVSLAAGLTPTFFGFFPGVGPVGRIRHAITPVVQWSWSPEAEVPEAYARALDPTGRNPVRRSPAQHRISLSLNQTFEGKFRPPPGDTNTDPRNARKIKLLSLQTSAIAFDFEQAKDSGRTGWLTQNLTNQFTSDLLRGFSLSTTHDLWDGPVGTDEARFSPFLTRISARFSISESTITGILGLIAGRSAPEPTEPPDAPDPAVAEPVPLIPEIRGDRFRDFDRRPRAPAGTRRPFTASVTFDDQRFRPIESEGDAPPVSRDANRTLGLSFQFDPTAHWSVSWTTQYNLTTKEFGQHVVRLERDMHRWRATFQFLKSPNGNFAFNFFISLLDQPDIRFNYDQQTLTR